MGGCGTYVIWTAFEMERSQAQLQPIFLLIPFVIQVGILEPKFSRLRAREAAENADDRMKKEAERETATPT
jgi:hypothetical protein